MIAHFVAITAFLIPAITMAQDAPSLMTGQPTAVSGPNGSTIIVPVSVSSRGPLPLSQVYIAGRLMNSDGAVVADSTAGPIEIPVGATGNLTFTLSVPQETDLSFRFNVGFSTPPFMSVQIELNGLTNSTSGGG